MKFGDYSSVCGGAEKVSSGWVDVHLHAKVNLTLKPPPFELIFLNRQNQICEELFRDRFVTYSGLQAQTPSSSRTRYVVVLSLSILHHVR